MSKMSLGLVFSPDLLAKTKQRIEHPRWPEFLEDVSAHWTALIAIGAYDGPDLDEADAEVDRLLDRFRQTFFGGLP